MIGWIFASHKVQSKLVCIRRITHLTKDEDTRLKSLQPFHGYPSHFHQKQREEKSVLSKNEKLPQNENPSPYLTPKRPPS